MVKTPEDRAVIQRLYQENVKKLYFIARSMVQNKAEAEEAVCVCFRKLTENFVQYRNQDYENLVRLSVILVKNAAAKMADIRDTEVTKGKGNDLGKSEKCTDQEEDCNMTRAVMMLKEDERHLLYLQHVMELRPKEISVLLDMEPKETRKKLLACSKKLKAALEEMSA